MLTLLTGRARSEKNLRANRRRMEAILNCLSGEFKPWSPYTEDPFLLLVGTVLSQNTNDRNSQKAFDRLRSRFNTPGQIAGADLREIQGLIRTGGLYVEKSKRLKEISRTVLERYRGNLRCVLRKPTDEARKELLSLPGVGYKTADVILAFGADRDVIPVDTHVFRVSKRLGFAGERDDLEEVKRKLEMVTPAGRRREAHVLLIQLGRRYCTARGPLHGECPINVSCPIGTRYVRHSRALHASGSTR